MKKLHENVINKMKKIVKNKSAMKIDGVMVDLYTASAVTQIYDLVNPANKKKMEKMSPQGLATFAFRVLGKKESVSEAKATPEEKAQLSLKHAREMDTLKDRQEREKETLMQKESLDESVKGERGPFSDAQLQKMKKSYSTLKRIDPSSQNYKKLKTKISELDVDRLEQIARAKIRFVSMIAAGEYAKKSGKRLHARDYMESTELEERKLTDAEMDKREKVAKAIEKDNPDMPMGKKMAIATNVAKGVQMENDEYDNEGGMALSQLRTAKSAVEDLMASIKEMDNLPEWVQSKLTKAVDYMDSVRDYMASKDAEEYVEEVELGEKYDSDKFFSGKGTPEQRLQLLKLQNKALRTLANSPKQNAIKKEIDALRKEMGMKVKKEEVELDESMARARADARRHMGGRGAQRGMAPLKKDVDNDATDGDRKAASKHIIQQIRKAADLPNGAEVEFKNGKGTVDRRSAQMVLQKYLAMKKPMDKEKFQASIKSLADVKKILGR